MRCMGPIPLALWQLLEAELYRSLQTEAMVRKDGVIFDQPGGHFAVKQGQVSEQQIGVIIHELLLYGAVEALTMGIHFG